MSSSRRNEFADSSPFFQQVLHRQPSTYPEGEKQQLQPYNIADTVAGGPPFHHDVLAHIISFVSSDLEALKSISAVRRSWRFFANYHHGWRRFEVTPWQKYLEKDAFTDLEKDKVILQRFGGGRREQPVPFLRDDLHGSVKSKIETVEEKRPSKAYYFFGSNAVPISTPLFLLSFTIFAILGCFNIAVGGNHDTDHGLDGRGIFVRRGEDDATGFNDGRVYLVGYKVAQKMAHPVYLNMRMCDGYVEETTTCSPCECQSSSNNNNNNYNGGSGYSGGRSGGRSGGYGGGSSFRRQEYTSQTPANGTTAENRSEQENNGHYYSRRSGSCRCCSTTTYWNKCVTATGSKTFDDCPELNDIAKNTVQWNLIHGIFALLSPFVFAGLVGLVSCTSCFSSYSEFVPQSEQKNIKFRVLPLFVALPVQVCLVATAGFSLNYADRLGKTPCAGWEELMKNDGGGDAIKSNGNGWSSDHNLRMMTVPLVISLVTGVSTLVLYGCWLSSVLATRPKRKALL